MDQVATWYGRRPRPRPHCVRWESSPLPGKGTQHPHFLAHFALARSSISAAAEHLLYNYMIFHIISGIDECASDNGGCSVMADCSNSEGGFTCTCQNGYVGDGFTCKGINVKQYSKCRGSKVVLATPQIVDNYCILGSGRQLSYQKVILFSRTSPYSQFADNNNHLFSF